MRDKPTYWNTSRWYAQFQKRWADYIRLRKAKDSTAARSSPLLWQRIPEFMKEYKRVLDAGNYLPKYVINIDETKASPNRRSGDEMVLASPGKQESHRTSKATAQPKTVVVCAAADGHVYMTVKIFAESTAGPSTKARKLLVPRTSPKTRKYWPRFYCYTDKGSMTQKLWSALITQLMKLVNETRTDLPVLLLCDHPTVHDDPALWKRLHDENTTMLFFPHNSSHILQPLDGAPFAEFKRVARLLQQDIVAERILTDEQQSELRSYVEEAEEQAFRRNTIIAGFVDRGIFPFAPEKIEANMKKILPPPDSSTPGPQDSLLIDTLNHFRSAIKSPYRSQVQAVGALAADAELFNSHDLVVQFEEKKRRKQAEEEEKKRKKAEKEAKRRQKEDEMREKRLNPPKRGRPRKNSDLPAEPVRKKARMQ